MARVLALVALVTSSATAPASADSLLSDEGVIRVPASVVADPDLRLGLLEADDAARVGRDVDHRSVQPGQEYVELSAVGRVIVYLAPRSGELRLDSFLTFYPGVPWREDATVIDIAPGEVVTLDSFEPLLGGTATGQVVTSDGTPLRGDVVVNAEPSGPHSDEVNSHSVKVDDRGGFEIRGMEPSDWRFQVAGSGSPTRSPKFSPYLLRYVGGQSWDDATRFPLSGQDSLDLGTIVMEDSGTLAGQVLDPDGAPVVGAVVTPRLEDGWARIDELVTDEQGRWDAGGVPNGSYTVSVDDPAAHVAFARTSADVSAGKPTAVSLVAPFHPPQLEGGVALDAARRGSARQGQTLQLTMGPPRQPDTKVTDVSWVRTQPVMIVGKGPTYTPPHWLDSNRQPCAVVTLERRGLTRDVLAGCAELRPMQPEGVVDEPDGGPPVVHEVLNAGTASSVRRSQHRWQWLRDGKAIRSAHDRRYRVKATDRGHRISVRSTSAEPGGRVVRRTTSRGTVQPGDTRMWPAFSPTDGGRTFVSASVGVPGVERRYVDGTALVRRVQGDSEVVVARFRVDDGWGATRFPSRSSGWSDYRLVFVPDDATMRGARSRTVPVPGLDSVIDRADSPWSPWLTQQLFDVG